MIPGNDNPPPLPPEGSDSDLQFPLDCECGKRLTVTEGAAGSRVKCSCGRTVEVPGLSALRGRAGLPPIRISTSTKIEEMVMTGELPRGTECSRCGATTSGILHVLAVCERVWVNTDQLSIGGVVIKEWGVSRHGRDLIVQVPVRLCPACQGAVFRYQRSWRSDAAAGLLGLLGLVLILWGILAAGILALAIALLIFLGVLWAERRREAVLKKLLCQEPLYRKLLDEYPGTELSSFMEVDKGPS
jgi:hypothetical protein